MKLYKAKDQTFKLADPIYNQDISVIIGGKEVLQRWCKRNKIRYEESSNYAETGEIDAGTHRLYYVHIPVFENTPLHLGVAGHEILHVAFRVLANIDFGFSYENTEPINYYFEMLYRDFLIKVYK